jgi:hypothetical protein
MCSLVAMVQCFRELCSLPKTYIASQKIVIFVVTNLRSVFVCGYHFRGT